MRCGESIDKCKQFEEEVSYEVTLNLDNTKRCVFPHIPACSSFKQRDYFSRTYLWLMYLDGKTGCGKCKEVSSLGLYNSPGIHMSQEWITCDIVPSGEKSVAQKSLRKKIIKQSTSKAHIIFERILKERMESKSIWQLENQWHSRRLSRRNA